LMMATGLVLLLIPVYYSLYARMIHSIGFDHEEEDEGLPALPTSLETAR